MKEYYLQSSLSLRHFFPLMLKIFFFLILKGFFFLFVIQIACFFPLLIFCSTNKLLLKLEEMSTEAHETTMLYHQFSL